MTDRDPDAEPGPEAALDAAWRDIVDHYGERAHLDEVAADPAPPDEAAPPELVTAAAPPDAEPPELAQAHVTDPEDHFVPPPAEPVPVPRGPRLLAWTGLFGAPAVVLVGVVTGVQLPSWLGTLLIGWFLGGFAYLVVTMPPDRDSWDDGAVL